MILRLDRRPAVPYGRPSGLIAAGICLLFLWASPSLAQDEEIPVVTKTTAIQNARIIQAPGRIIERGTVVLRDGLITAVGSDVEIPYDADVIAGDSLTVYAGFVDGLSHAGIPKKDEQRQNQADREDRINPADPPNDLAGIQPDRDARELLDPSDASVANLRRLGFTVAHVVPRGRMLPGTGSVILLTGKHPREMVLRPGISMFMQFEGAPGMYPATTIGVMSTLRQLLREAERRRRIERMYAENPTGLERPAYDPVHEAFYPVLGQEIPIVVLADGDDSALEVHRALQLRDELDFTMSLAGLSQGFDVVDDLENEGIPLFLTLNLPKEPDEDDKDTTAVDTTKAITPEDPATHFVSDLRTHSFEDVEAEKDNLEVRQAMQRRRYYETAADFHEAGLRFGYTTVGAETKDVRDNLQKMIEAGLPEDAALAALTIDGARLLGIDRSVGTVEEGKLANLVVTKGSYFDPKSPIRYVFIDGRKYEYEEEETRSGDGTAIAGEWEIEVETDEGPISGVITLDVDGDDIAGTVSSETLRRPADIEDAELEGDRLTFAFRTSEYGRISADLTISGNTLSGTMDIPGEGALEVTGMRGPDAR